MSPILNVESLPMIHIKYAARDDRCLYLSLNEMDDYFMGSCDILNHDVIIWSSLSHISKTSKRFVKDWNLEIVAFKYEIKKVYQILE